MYSIMAGYVGGGGVHTVCNNCKANNNILYLLSCKYARIINELGNITNVDASIHGGMRGPLKV